jgi:hypothetical protein
MAWACYGQRRKMRDDMDKEDERMQGGRIIGWDG